MGNLQLVALYISNVVPFPGIVHNQLFTRYVQQSMQNHNYGHIYPILANDVFLGASTVYLIN